MAAVKARSRRSIGKSLRRSVYERDNWSCHYCGVQILPDTDEQRAGGKAPFFIADDFKYVWLELDHIVPFRYGGMCTVDNFRSACTPCNKDKRTSTRECDWPQRAAIAQEILEQEEPDRSAIQRAARALLGVNVRIDDNGNVSI